MRGRSRKMGANMRSIWVYRLISFRAVRLDILNVRFELAVVSPPKGFGNAGSAQFPVFPKIYTEVGNSSGNSSVTVLLAQNGLERFCCSRAHVFARAGPA